ncbi:MAG: tRNA (5-methylaminomethyl-2-thiouridylate)-methyltransferase [Nitrososphaerota archaeon]|nr:tRNA (5-methylaminomethyl-2-thiouridylate)-methyltransferase [Nitrososphaerota archaeon]
MSKRKPKALVMLSGGLDSTLALATMKELGVETLALSFKTPFCNFDCGGGACAGDVSDVARRMGVKWRAEELGEEYVEMVRKPKHGYGSGMNPCIDCRIMMFRRAKEVMGEVGADFMVTGEVVGQRPMSQNPKALETIEKESGLKGKILRPLSARLLPPTDAETEGMVDRRRLKAISGRSRKEQISLAAEFGLKKYPNAGGGCVLTEKGFASRLRDLFQHSEKPGMREIRLLGVGRHFRLSDSCKLVVGRDMVENREISSLAEPGETLMAVQDYVGPVCLLVGQHGEEGGTAAGICVRYSDAPKDREVTVRLFDKDEKLLGTVVASALAEERYAKYRL